MRLRDIQLEDGAGGVRLAYVERGSATRGRTVVCVHGLTRNARDFDALAERLARSARVLCVDVAGRGRSSWLADARDYRLEVYAAHLRRFLDLLGLARVDWVGTSMGGLIALEIARREPARFSHLVLNDIGPFVPAASLAPIRAYLGEDRAFADLEALEAHLREIHAGFGPLTDEQWRHLAVHSAREEQGVVRLHYDPRIREPFLQETAADLDLWPGYEALRCPILVLRGALSAVLDAATAQEMLRRNPRARLVTFSGVGHAPALMDSAQIETIARFLAL